MYGQATTPQNKIFVDTAPTGRERNPQVVDTLMSLRCTSDRFEIVLDRLTARLQSVLSPAEPPCKESGECYPTLVPVAQEIRDIDWKISRLLNEMDTLTQRIEV